MLVTVKISNNLPSSTLAADKHDREFPTVLFHLQRPLNMSVSSDYQFRHVDSAICGTFGRTCCVLWER